MKSKFIVKSMSMVMAAIMMVSVFAGCGKKADNSGGTAGADAAKNEPRGSISVTIYDRGNIPASEGTPENNRWTKWINENSPVDVKFVPIPRTKPEDKISLLFASGDAPDLVLDYNYDLMKTFASQKLIIPLDDAIDKYSKEYKALLTKYPALKRLAVNQTEDGKMYMVGRVGEPRAWGQVVIRTDWLKKLGLSMPKTTDDVLNIAKAFTEKDPDGNSKNDTFGFAMPSTDTTIAGWFGSVMSGSTTSTNDDYSFPADRLKAYISYMKNMFNNGYVDKDYLLDTNGAKAKAAFVTGKAGMYPLGSTNGPTFARDQYTTLKKNVPNAQVDIFQFVESPVGNFWPAINPPYNLCGYVNASTKDIKSVVKYIDWMASNEPLKKMKFGLEGVHYKTEADGTITIIDSEKFKNEVGYNADYYSLLGSAYIAGRQYMTIGNYNLASQNEKEVYDLDMKSMKSISDTMYANLKTATPDIFSGSYPIPKDMLTAKNTITNDLQAAIDKSISTKDITPDQAVKDIVTMREKVGLNKYDQWVLDFTKKNPDRVTPFKEVSNLLKESYTTMIGK